MNGHAQPHVEAPGGRSARKRAATAPFQAVGGARGGGGGGGKEGEGEEGEGAAHEQIVTEAVRPVDAFIKTAALSTASIDELRNLAAQMIQKLEQAGLYTRGDGAGSSASSATASAAAAIDVVNADDDDDEQDATPVQGNDGSVVLDADEVLDAASLYAEPPAAAVAPAEAAQRPGRGRGGRLTRECGKRAGRGCRDGARDARSDRCTHWRRPAVRK